MNSVAELQSCSGWQEAGTKGGGVNLTLAVALMALVAWIILGFVVPVGAGWVHLLLALGMILLVRRVVAGKSAW